MQEKSKMNCSVKFSVVIITYNQEELITRAIESVLVQKENVYEIIVSDDCSIDNTWRFIKEYSVKFPKIIKPFRNDRNLGIFEHLVTTWAYPSGDIIFYLAGDDILVDGLLKQAKQLIIDQDIDYSNNAVTLYFDYKEVRHSGEEMIFSNSLILKHNPISLKIRNLISNRTTGVSRKIIEKYYRVDKNIGIYADGLLDIQTQLFSEKNYYSPFIGSTYYSGVGISVRTKRIDALHSRALYINKLKESLPNISKSDRLWLEYLDRKYSFALTPSMKNYFRYFRSFFSSLEFQYGLLLPLKELKSIALGFFRIKQCRFFYRNEFDNTKV